MKIDGAFDALHQHISHLTDGMEKSKDLARLVRLTAIRQDGESEADVINYLIFQPKEQTDGDLTFVVVICPHSKTVDISKLLTHLAAMNVNLTQSGTFLHLCLLKNCVDINQAQFLH